MSGVSLRYKINCLRLISFEYYAHVQRKQICNINKYWGCIYFNLSVELVLIWLMLVIVALLSHNSIVEQDSMGEKGRQDDSLWWCWTRWWWDDQWWLSWEHWWWHKAWQSASCQVCNNQSTCQTVLSSCCQSQPDTKSNILQEFNYTVKDPLWIVGSEL